MGTENNLGFESQVKELDPGLFTEADMRLIERAEDSIRLKLNLAGECLVGVGRDLIDLQEQLNANGNRQGFNAWASSPRCPIGSYKTALDLMAVAREHQQNGLSISSIDLLLSKKGPGIQAIGRVLRLKDEAVKQAALEYTMSKVEAGEKVTQAEAKKTMAELKEAYKKIDESKAREMTLEQKIQKLQEEREKLAEREKKEREKKDEYYRRLLDASQEKKAIKDEMERKLRDKQQQLKDAEEVHREHLAEMRRQIAEEERNRPRTDAEIAEHQAKLQALQDEAARAQTAFNQATKAKTDLERELNDLRKEVALRDKVLNDWGTASIGFREIALRLTGSTDGLKRIPLTDELYSQIKMIRELAATIVSKLDEVTHVG